MPSPKRPIRAVFFIYPNGAVLSWKREEIRADPEAFRRFCDAERAAHGVRPLAMR